MSTTLTAEEAAAALGGSAAAEAFQCPQCGRTFDSAAKLNGHLGWHKTAAGRAAAAGGKGKPDKPTPPAPSPGIPESLLELAKSETAKAIKNTKATAHFPLVMGLAPHTALTLAGLKDDQGNVIIRSRAEIAGELILEIRDAEVLRRVVAMLRWYNSLFELTKAADLIGSVAVAGAVDARVIPPDFTIHVPVGGMQLDLPIVQAAIGDVTAELAARGLYESGEQPPETPGENGATPAGETISGGVENT